MEHFGFLFAAYTAIFVVIFLYVMFIWRRQEKLAAEIDLLEAELGALKANSGGRAESAKPD